LRHESEDNHHVVIIGGGSTGVGLTGTLAELSYKTFENEYRNIKSRNVRIFLLEGTDRLLPTYPGKFTLF